jgi:oligopeptide/dipeptide ABC transporter ATP-binding protein
VLPNIAEPLTINAATGAGGALLAFASLSFLGLGVQPPSYDWGRLLLEGLNRVYLAPAAALGPAVAVVFAGLTFSLLGEVTAIAFGHRSTTARAPRRAIPEPSVTSTRALERLSGGEAGGEEHLLEVRELNVSLPTKSGQIRPVVDVSFSMRPGEIVGIVGESGSGKSMTALSIAGLLPGSGSVEARRLTFAGTPLLGLSERSLRARLGASLAVIFQDPMSSLNPALRVGRQVGEVAEVHAGATRSEARELAVAALSQVQISEPRRRSRQYPHEFSGGMRQRAMIAMGLIGRPRLVIADEPTTALDVTVQRRILTLLRDLRDAHGIAVLLISHDMAVISELCERVLVMYSGRVVEEGPIHQILTAPRHPYTRALVATIPNMDTDPDRPLATIAGRPPHPAARPSGCAYGPRCDRAQDRCHIDVPPMTGHVDITDGKAADDKTSDGTTAGTETVGGGTKVACWFPHQSCSGPAEERVSTP